MPLDTDVGPSIDPRNDEGVVAVIVALLLVVFVGISALAIDIGSAWSSQRQLVADLDAASLAGVQAIEDIGHEACEVNDTPVVNEVIDIAGLNGVAIDPDDVNVQCQEGIVTVAGQRPAISTFSAAMGLDELLAGALSASVIEPEEVGGVLPVAICVNEAIIEDFAAVGSDPNDTTWMGYRTTPPPGNEDAYPQSDTSGLGYYSPDDRVEFVVAKTGVERVWKDEMCGDEGEGNWGWLDWTDSGGGVNELRQSIEDGNGDVSLPPSPKCGYLEDGNCAPHPGGKGQGSNSPAPNLRDTWACAANDDECPPVAFIVYDEVIDGGSGTRYKLSGFLLGRLWDVEFHPNHGQLHIEPLDYITSGTVEDLDTRNFEFRVCRAEDVSNCPGN